MTEKITKPRTLLILSPWFPYPPDNGSRQRIYFLLRELAKTETIRLVAGTQSDSPADVPPELAGLCENVVRVPWVWHDGSRGGLIGAVHALLSPTPRSILETPNPPLVAAIAAELARTPAPDALLVCETGMDAYLPPNLPPGLPVVLEGAEVSGLERAVAGATSPRARLRATLTRRKGIRYWGIQMRRRYRAITAASPGEADALRRALAAGSRAAREPVPPVVIVPNGVDVAAFAPRDPSAVVPGRLIYTGSLTYGANRDAAEYFARDVLPLIVARVSDAHLVVTGRVPLSPGYPEGTRGIGLGGIEITFTGYLPDLKPTLQSAAVCIVPLLSGGGTRLKILEAWAAGVPVVATPVGADGLEGAVSGEHLLIAPDAASFAQATVDLLTQPALAARLAANARRLAQSRYDWEEIGARLANLLAEMTAP